MNRPARRAVYAVVLAVVLVGCDGHTSVKGVVSTMDGRPVAGASVHLAPVEDVRPNADTKSAGDGSYYIGMTHAPSWTVVLRLTVTKDGYRTFSKEYQANKNYRCDVALVAENP